RRHRRRIAPHPAPRRARDAVCVAEGGFDPGRSPGLQRGAASPRRRARQVLGDGQARPTRVPGLGSSAMRYAVTGAAGFIGSHLAEALVAAGHDVIGFDSFTDYYDPALKEDNARGLDVRRVDLGEAPLDFAEFDAVFHLAGQPGARSFGHVFPDYLWRN